ncbi:hypothetical protein DPMN_096782, partial [Dreissena polymorpha]
LSSDNHLVDGPTDQQTDMSKAIYTLFFEGGHKNSSAHSISTDEFLIQDSSGQQLEPS